MPLFDAMPRRAMPRFRLRHYAASRRPLLAMICAAALLICASVARADGATRWRAFRAYFAAAYMLLWRDAYYYAPRSVAAPPAAAFRHALPR